MLKKIKFFVMTVALSLLFSVPVSAIRVGCTMTNADFTPGGRILWSDVTDECRAKIKQWEGCSLDAVLDKGGEYWAQGYGHLVCETSQGKPSPISQAQAEAWFEEDLHKFDDFIVKWCFDQNIKSLTRGQYSCIVSFLYQFGPYHTGPNGESYMYESGWWGDRLARYIRGGADWQQFYNEAILYNKKDGRANAAIKVRRETEARWALN